MSNFFKSVILTMVCCSIGCTQASLPSIMTPAAPPLPEVQKVKNPGRVVHVLVALCDNENQGIVPVSATLGNGEAPKSNLYWGAAYGVKTYFSKSKDWTKISETKDPKPHVLERLVFKHKTEEVYLVADAYRGSKMRETIDDFFSATAGTKRENVAAQDKTLQVLGSADLVAFVGHNGLMDFKLDKQPVKKDDDKRDAIILACASRNYFTAPLKNTSANPLLWTTNLMAPEAYILHDALDAWVKNETDEQVRTRGASAYAKYQRIPEKAARNLLVTGW